MEALGSNYELDYLSEQAGRSRSNTIISRCSSRFSSYINLPVSETETPHSDEEQVVERPVNPHLDAGRAWWSILGALLSAATIGGIERSFGIQTLYIQEKFNVTSYQSSWIGSLSTMLRFLCGTVSGLLIARYGCYKVTFVGSAICFIGFSASAFVPIFSLLYITYGLLPGIGSSLAYLSAGILINENFDRLRGRANGLALAGSGIGSFSYPIFIQYLESNYGLSGEMLILGGMSAHLFLTSTLYYLSDPERVYPHLYQKSNNSNKNKDDDSNQSGETNRDCWSKVKRFFRNTLGCDSGSNGRSSLFVKITFTLLVFSMASAFMGFMGALFLLPTLAEEKGLATSEAAWLVSILGIWDIIGRASSGPIFDKFVRWRLYIYSGCYLGISLSCFLMPFMNKFYEFVIVTSLMGYFSGTMIAMRSVVCVDIVGKDSFRHYYGLLVSVQGIGVLIGPPIASSLLTNFGESSSSFYFCGSVQILAAVLLSIIPILLYKHSPAKPNIIEK